MDGPRPIAARASAAAHRVGFAVAGYEIRVHPLDVLVRADDLDTLGRRVFIVERARSWGADVEEGAGVAPSPASNGGPGPAVGPAGSRAAAACLRPSARSRQAFG